MPRIPATESGAFLSDGMAERDGTRGKLRHVLYGSIRGTTKLEDLNTARLNTAKAPYISNQNCYLYKQQVPYIGNLLPI